MLGMWSCSSTTTRVLRVLILPWTFLLLRVSDVKPFFPRRAFHAAFCLCVSFSFPVAVAWWGTVTHFTGLAVRTMGDDAVDYPKGVRRLRSVFILCFCALSM